MDKSRKIGSGPDLAEAKAKMRAYCKTTKKNGAVEPDMDEAKAALRAWRKFRAEGFAYPHEDEESGKVSNNDVDDHDHVDDTDSGKTTVKKYEHTGFAYVHGDQESGIASVDDVLDRSEVDDEPSKIIAQKSYEHFIRKIKSIVHEDYSSPLPMSGNTRAPIAGSMEDKIRQVCCAIHDQTVLQNTDIVATFDGQVVVYDWSNCQYWGVNYQQTESGDVIIGAMRQMEPQLVVKEQREQLLRFFREHLTQPDTKKARGLSKIAEHLFIEAVWTTAYMNDLPDSSFAVIEPGGTKDESGKTVPRTLRHLPYKDADGKVDMAHLNDAFSRLPQTDISADLKTKAKAVLTRARNAATKAESSDAAHRAWDRRGRTLRGEHIRMGDRSVRVKVSQ